MRRLQYDAPSQAVRNLITNPELVADVSDKLLYKNAVTNPSFETAGSTFDLWVNNVMNPSFRNTSGNTETRRNLALNPSMEATTGTPEVRRNHVTYPSFELTSGTATLRTNMITNPAMEATGSGITVRTNLATNPAFETASGTTTVRYNLAPNPVAAVSSGWFAANGVAATGTTNVAGGPPGIPTMARTTATGTATGMNYFAMAYGQSTATGAVVVAGKSYIASLWVRATMDNFTQQPVMRLRWKDSSGVTISDVPAVAAVGTRSGQWVRLSAKGTAPVNTAYIEVMGGYTSIDQSTITVGDTVDVTGILIEEATNLDAYFDANNGSVMRTNLQPDPSFQSGIGSWINNGPGTLATSTEQAYTGTQSLKVVPGQENWGYHNPYSMNLIVPGQTYTFSVYVYSPTSQNLCLTNYNGTAVQGPSVSVPAGAWTRLHLTQTIPTNATAVWISVRNPDRTTIPSTFYLDAYMIEQTSTLQPYFDGSTTADAGTTNSWSGTANASASVMKDNGYTYAWQGGANASISHMQAPALGGGFTSQANLQSRVYQKSGPGTISGKSGSIYKQLGYSYLNVNLTGLKSSTTYTYSIDVLSPIAMVATVDRGTSEAPTYSKAEKTVTPNVVSRISRSFTTGASDTTRTLSLVGWESADAPDGSTLVVDNLLIEEMSVAMPYFDGATAAAEGLTYAWTGTANSSTSEQRGVAVATRQGLAPERVAWQSTARAYHGTKSGAVLVKVNVADDATLSYPVGDWTIGTHVSANTTYTWSAYVYVPTGAGAVQLVEVGSGARSAGTTVNNQWQRLSVTFTTAATGAVFLRLRSKGNVPAGSIIWWDSELFEISSGSLPYFDGSNPAYQNLVSNPSFTTNVAGYTGMGATLTRVTNQGGDGAVCELTQSIGGASREGAIYIHGSQLPAGSYTVSFDYKGTDASFTNVRTMLYDQATANVVSQSPSPTTPLIKDGNFNRYTHTLVASAPFDRIYIEVLGTSIPLGAKLWLDRVLVEHSESAVGQYYEGTGDITTAWTGTSNASTSTMTAPNVAGWATGVSGLLRSTIDPKIGAYSAALMTKGFNGDGLWPGTDMDAIAGRTYTYSAWIKTTSAHGLTAAFRWKDSGFVSLGDTNVSVTTQLTVGAWSLVSATATAPANTVKVQMMLRIYETHTPTTFYLDGAIFTESHTAVPYFDGSTAASGDFTYAWIGAAHASASAQLGVGVSELPTTGSVAAISSTDWKGLGSRSLRLISLVTTSADTFTHLSGDTGAMRLGMVAGKTYTISGTCRITAPQTGTMSARARRLVLFHRSPGEQNYTEVQSTQAPNVAGQARVFLTFTIPSTVTECFIRAYHGGQAGSADVWWDDILVEESAILRPYFDGARPAVENLVKSAALGQYVATHTTGVSYAGATWTRITTPAGTSQSLTRQYVDVNFLRTGEMYTTAVTVANDGATSVTIYFDWADVANTTHVIAPGEQKRIVTKGVRSTGYDNTYRFADLHIQQVSTESKSILFRDWLIELGDTAGDYYSGTREFTYEWAGASNTSASIEKAPAVVANSASKGGPPTYPNSAFLTYQSIDETGKKIARWVTPAGTGNSGWRVININTLSLNYQSIIAGSTYTLIFKYRSSGWGAGSNFYTSMRDPGAQNVVMDQDIKPLNTGWTEYRRTFTALINGLASTVLYISLPTIPPATTDGIFDIAEWALVPGVYTGPFFDGSSAPTSSDFTVAWSGVVDASISKVIATSVAGTPGNYSGRLSWQSNGGPVAGKKSVAVISGTPNVDTFVQLPTPFSGENLAGRTFTILATRKTMDNLPASGNDGRAWRPLWQVQRSDGTYEMIMPPVGPTTAGVYKFKHTFTFGPLASTTNTFFRIYNGSATPGTTVYWDDVAIIEGAYPGDYFDGDTVDTADNTYLWDGTAHASASSMRGINIKGVWSGHRANVYSSSDTPFSGSHKVKASVTQIGYFPRLISNSIAVVPGRRYSAFAKMKCATQPVQIAIAWVTGGTTSPIGQAASNGNWVRPYISDIAPEGAQYAQLYMGVPNDSPLNTEFEIDSILFTDRAYDGPFGSGSSYGWEWNGTPHESTSKGYPVGLMQLAGKPLAAITSTGYTVLTDIDPAKNPVIPSGAPRTIYTIVDNLQVVPTGQLPTVWVYGIEALNDTVPNTTIIMRQQSQSGNLTNTVMARRTGGAGANTLNVPATGKQILIAGMDANGVLFSAVNKSPLTLDTNFPMNVPHERIHIAVDSPYHKHVATYIYPGVHSSAVRAEMVKLLADHHNIPGLG